MRTVKLNIKIRVWGTILILSISGIVMGQGCSDAGFCTIDSFKPHQTDNLAEYYNNIKVGISYGKADHSIYTIGSYIEYNREINSKLGLGLKFTNISQNGNEISTFGVSDLFLNANYSVSEKAKITLGTKIPFNDANKKENGLSLPMDYQSSLGTIDLILGFAYQIQKFQLAIALQQPLTQNNNEFLADNYPEDSELRNFQSTNKFKRSGDILLRASYPINLGNKFRFTPSILPIYHLANDKYTNAEGVEMEITGSNGLTLNANAFLDFELNEKNIIQLNFGMPLVVRDVRPDGLTRSFIATLEYRIRF